MRIGSAGEAKRHGIAYVPEDRGSQGLIRPMTLRENVSLAVLRRIARRGFIDRGEEEGWRPTPSPASPSAPAARTRSWASSRAATSRRSCSASGWRPGPKLLIMDEPTRGIDVGAKAEIHRLMSELAAQGWPS